jgi:hypothetical protein
VSAHQSHGSLTIVVGPASGRGFILPLGPTLLGRAPEADVVLTDTSVSWLHAELMAGATNVEIRDLKSTNGTFVNGARIVESTELRDGDEVRVGSYVLRFSVIATPSLPQQSVDDPGAPSGSNRFRDVRGPVQTGSGRQVTAGRDQVFAGRDQHFGDRVDLQNDYDPWDEIWQGRGVGRALMVIGGLLALAGFAMWIIFIFGMGGDPSDFGNPFLDRKLIGDIPLSVAGFSCFAIGGVLAGIGSGMSKAARKRAERAMRGHR